MISVVISVLNGGSTLDACLKSVIEQEFKHMELIVIDGGSVDTTLDIVNKYQEYINYSVSEPDTGIYNAWNKAIRISKGNWVCFIGSDDIFFSKSALSQLARFALYPAINYVSGRAALINSAGVQLAAQGKPYDSKGLAKGMKFSHPGSLHHISLFRDHGLFDESYKIAGDYEFFLRCNDSIHAAFAPSTVVLMGDSGMSNTKQSRVFFEGYRALLNTPGFGIFAGLRFLLSSFSKLAFRKLLQVLR